MHKILLACCLILIPGITLADDSLLSVPGLANAVALVAKNAKAVGLVDLKGKFSGGTFVPVRTLHDSLGINYVELGLGGAIKQGESFKPLVIADGDISAIVRRLEGKSAWYQAHINKLVLPDVWLGPSIQPPVLPGMKWAFGGALSVRL